MSDIVSFAREIGLQVDYIPADGKWHRYKTEAHPHKRNGAVKLSDDGRIGWVQDWATHTEPITWKADKDSVFHVPTKDLARQRHEARLALIAATKAAREFYQNCDPLRGGHPYLESHGLDMTGCLGLKIDVPGWLVVPAMVDGQLRSIQRISPEGEKKYWKGAAIKGASYIIDRKGATITALCEGLATGLAIYAAAPLVRVAVAFDAGNMPRVAERMVKRGMMVVASDNDKATAERTGANPGVVAATEAARIIGCGVAVPEGIEGTDWCDYRMEMIEKKSRLLRGSQARIAVDAEIASAMQRYAKFVTVRARA